MAIKWIWKEPRHIENFGQWEWVSQCEITSYASDWQNWKRSIDSMTSGSDLSKMVLLDLVVGEGSINVFLESHKTTY